MNWEAIGAVGEVVGAIAVVLTLVYLAFQLRHNTKSMDETRKVEIARTVQSRTELRFELFRSILQSPELMSAHAQMRELTWPRSKEVFDSLSEHEQQSFYNWSRMQILILDNLHSQNQMGLISKDVAEGIIPVIETWGPFWLETGLLRGFRSAFVAEVERIVGS